MARNIFFAGLVVFLLPIAYAHAQLSSVPDPVQYTVSPENPGPNQFVSIQVEGVGMFLGNSTITWQQNGKVVSAGVGQTLFSFTTDGIGTPTQIRLTIDSSTQGTITHDFIFNPSIVNLVWEADTYTPLLYRGKALYSAGSTLRIIAFPTVVLGKQLITSDKLSFQWFRNEDAVPSASGLGKNIFVLEGDQLQNSENISVKVYSGATAVGKGDITVPATTPQVILYNKDPLRGELLDEAMPNTVSLAGKEITIQAEPYFFSSNSKKNGAITYSWMLNGQDAAGPNSAEGILTLRQTGEGPGAASVSVSAQNTNSAQFAQQASVSLQIAFGQQAGSAISSFFGL